MRILKARFRNGDEFLQHYDASFAHGGMFYPTRRAIPVGEAVVVAVRIGRPRDPVLLRGYVAWRRTGQHTKKIRAGVAVEFMASERGKRAFLIELARGSRPQAPIRRHLRLPIDLPVSWRLSGSLEENTGVLRDIGRGGAFLHTDATERAMSGVGREGEDSEVVVNVAPPGAAVAMPVSARIAWIGGTGGEPGFGITWRARDAGGSRRIRELVRRMSE